MTDTSAGRLLTLIRAGDWAAALPLASQLAEAAPRDASRLAMLGHVQRRSGNTAAAVLTLQSSTRLNGHIPAAWFDLAMALLDSERPNEADTAARQHLQLAPQSAEAHYLRFRTFAALGSREAADQAFQDASSRDGRLVARRLRLADACFDRGTHGEAVWHYRRLRERDPALEAAWTGEIASLMRAGQLDIADAALADAIAHHPAKAAWLRGHVEIGQQRSIDPEALLARLARWRTQCPNDKEAAVGQFTVLCDLLRFDEAKAVLRELASPEGHPLLAQWAGLFLPSAPVFDGEQAIAQFLAQVDRGLGTLENDARTGGMQDNDAIDALVTVQHFLLPYVPEGSDVLLRRHAALASQTTAHLANPAPRTTTCHGRFRIAVVSAHFHLHSASRVMRDLICALPADEFELHGFQIGSHQDISVDAWRKRCTTFISGHRRLNDWCAALRECAADAVLFLDLAMDGLTQALASIRHARVQLTTWGHPITSGLPTIDYFVSSDICEPDDAASHYTESLWRLPGLANAYLFLPPSDRPPRPKPTGVTTRLACPQSGFKLTPDHDALFREILEAVPGATLDLSTQWPTHVEAPLRQRMASGMPAPVFERIRFNPPQPYADYVRLVRDSDVLIDTMHWSGGLTSMDALHLGVPVVTLPGRVMRGRQTYGMLRTLDLPDLVADSRDDLVKRVIDLCLDHHRRDDISAAIRDRHERLVGCDDAVADLARRLRDALG